MAKVVASMPNSQLKVALPPQVAASKSWHQVLVKRVLFLMGLGGSVYMVWRLYNSYNRRQVTVVADQKLPETKLENEDKIFVRGRSKGLGFGVKLSQQSEHHDANNNEITKSEQRVVLHLCPRGFFTPSVSPFSLKLETFLRVARIPYETDFSHGPGDINVPWMTIGKEEIPESSDCLRKISCYYSVNLEDKALNSRKIACRLVDVMLEHHLYWAIALWRWVYDEGRTMPLIQPLPPSSKDSLRDTSSAVSNAAWYHGLGRLPPNQVLSIIVKDLEDLAAALGKHPYFLGENPGVVDCGAFAMLCQMLWNMPGSPYESAVKRHKNLVDFVLRMRDRYWADWNQQLSCKDAATCDAETLLPGTEFHQKRQFNSENASGEWESASRSRSRTHMVKNPHHQRESHNCLNQSKLEPSGDPDVTELHPRREMEEKSTNEINMMALSRAAIGGSNAESHMEASPREQKHSNMQGPVVSSQKSTEDQYYSKASLIDKKNEGSNEYQSQHFYPANAVLTNTGKTDRPLTRERDHLNTDCSDSENECKFSSLSLNPTRYHVPGDMPDPWNYSYPNSVDRPTEEKAKSQSLTNPQDQPKQVLRENSTSRFLPSNITRANVFNIHETSGR